jgi:hypothetical protein
LYGRSLALHHDPGESPSASVAARHVHACDQPHGGHLAPSRGTRWIVHHPPSIFEDLNDDITDDPIDDDDGWDDLADVFRTVNAIVFQGSSPSHPSREGRGQPVATHPFLSSHLPTPPPLRC